MGEQKNEKVQVQEQDIHQLLKVRREKLADLQERGLDPFQITKYDVTNHSQEIKDDFEALEGNVEAITPVPGGVGSVTTALLMYHVVMAAKVQ